MAVGFGYAGFSPVKFDSIPTADSILNILAVHFGEPLKAQVLHG
jgi:hypothetical protein